MPLSVRDIPFFKDLSDAEFQAVKGCLKERSFEKGESLFLEGNICERVFFVRSGRVKLTRTSSTGREQTLETLGPGDTCACHPGTEAWHCASSAVALAPGSAWFLSKENFSRLVRSNPKASLALNRLFAERLQCFSSLIEEVSLKDSRTRLVRFLLVMQRENKGAVPLTQEEVAQRIGTARETVARQLQQLKVSGLIDIKPGLVTVLDPPGLSKLL